MTSLIRWAPPRSRTTGTLLATLLSIPSDPTNLKLGGHQASAAWMVGIMTAWYFR